MRAPLKKMATLQAIILATLAFAATCGSAQNEDFVLSNGPVPDPFQLHQHYPDRPETVECRPIQLRIARGSRRFMTELVTNDHADVSFASADARIMSLRMHRHLNELAEAFHAQEGVWISVLKAWADEDDPDITDPNSLHYEGENIRYGRSRIVSELPALAHTWINVWKYAWISCM
jgi:hypothetical protein